jgi:hypothetical protein
MKEVAIYTGGSCQTQTRISARKHGWSVGVRHDMYRAGSGHPLNRCVEGIGTGAAVSP